MTEPPRTRWLLFAGALGLALAVLALVSHARSYLPFFPDDSFISLRYADRLGGGEGLTFSPGERAEGYSNFLWVVLLGFVAVFSEGLILPARIFGTAFVALTMVAFFVAARPRRMIDLTPPVFAALILAASGPVAAWAIGGLEGTLVAMLATWGIVLAYPLVERPELGGRGTLGPGLFLGLACLSRPDGPLFTVAVAGALVVILRFRRAAFATALRVAAIPMALTAAQLVFRRVYHGDWLPNTFYAKVAVTDARLQMGWGYFWDGAPSHAALIALSAFGAATAFGGGARARRIALAGVPVIAWVAYVMVVGGDFFPQRRHFVPMTALLCLVILEGCLFIAELRRRARVALVALALAGALALFHVQQRRDPEAQRAKNERWNWAGQSLGIFIRKAFGPREPLLAVDAAGTLPYFARTPTLDMLGLNDFYLAHHRPADFGRGHLGHELGDVTYFLERRPDIVVFHTMTDTPLWPAGRRLVRSTAFKREYDNVQVKGHDGSLFRIWLRHVSPRIGIRRSPDRVVVPGYLLASQPTSVTRVSPESGRPGVVVTDTATATRSPFRLSAGRWRVRADATPSDVSVFVEVKESGARLASGARELTVEIPAKPPALHIVVQGRTKAETLVYEVAFDRLGD